jgi:hypothetical protein
MFFANEQRLNVRDENPGISFGESTSGILSHTRNVHRRRSLTSLLPSGQVGKVLGERWKALNEKQRQPYEAKAAADKERYENAKAQYNVSG